MMTTDLSAVDIEALQRALRMAREENQEQRERLDQVEAKKGWEGAALTAVYHLQCKVLKLRPWEAPPMHTYDKVFPEGGYGRTEAEVALRRRLLAAELSLYEPDPVAALQAALNVA